MKGKAPMNRTPKETKGAANPERRTRKPPFVYICELKDGARVTLDNIEAVKARGDVLRCRIEPGKRLCEAPKKGNTTCTRHTPGRMAKGEKKLPYRGAGFWRCLCVKPPYALAIVTGEKVKEYRTRPTRIRGRVGIIESGSGTIIGDAVLYDCTERGEWDYIWHFRDARRYAVPLAYHHPVGAVVWVKVPCH